MTHDSPLRPTASSARARSRRTPRVTLVGYVMLAIFVGACSSNEVDAPAPTLLTTAVPDSLPALPPSIVEAPISYDLTPAMAVLEQAIPRRFGNLEHRAHDSATKRMHSSYAAEREPFQMTVSGRTIEIVAVVHYQGRGWYDPPVGPEVSGSCGINQERPRARIRISSTFRLTEDWKLRSRTKLGAVEPLSAERRDACKVTIFNIDVTGRVMAATRGALEKKLSEMDARIGAIDVRKRFEGWWNALQRPMRLSDSVWLLINPSAVRLGSIAGAGPAGREVVARISLSGAPRIVTGPRPWAPRVPLPPLREKALVGNGMHVMMEAELDYDVASAMLRKRLKGLSIERGGNRIEIRDLRLSGIGGGKVALALRFSGAGSGLIYFVGTPRFDPETDQLYVPDLDYDVGSATLLVRGLEWMKRGEVRNFLLARARWPVGDLMAKARERLEKGMNRNLGTGARLEARVREGKALGVLATPETILLRARADGEARLIVTKVPSVGKKP